MCKLLGGEVRVIEEAGELWFKRNDIKKVLNYVGNATFAGSSSPEQCKFFKEPRVDRPGSVTCSYLSIAGLRCWAAHAAQAPINRTKNKEWGILLAEVEKLVASRAAKPSPGQSLAATEIKKLPVPMKYSPRNPATDGMLRQLQDLVIMVDSVGRLAHRVMAELTEELPKLRTESMAAQQLQNRLLKIKEVIGA